MKEQQLIIVEQNTRTGKNEVKTRTDFSFDEYVEAIGTMYRVGGKIKLISVTVLNEDGTFGKQFIN